ncbi:MAG: hypothetical protein R3Y59_06420 [bacterium]
MDNREMSFFDFIRYCCRAFVRLMKNIGIFSLHALRLGVQYFWVVVLFAALGVIAGWIWAKPFATTYKGESTILFTDGMRSNVRSGISLFLSSPENVKKERYGLSDEAFESFKGLELFNVVDANFDSLPDYVDYKHKVALSDTVQVVLTNRVHMRVEMKGKAEFSNFQQALVNCFESQPSIVQADSVAKAIQRGRLDFLKYETARLDSFTNHEYFQKPIMLGHDWGSVFLAEQSKDLRYEDAIALNDKLVYHQWHIDRTPNILNFETPFVVIAFPPIYKYMVGFIVGLVVGLLVALLLKNREAVVLYFKEK